jgi:hypothetical protein
MPPKWLTITVLVWLIAGLVLLAIVKASIA